MDKKIAGLLGAVAAFGTLTTAQAATEPAPNPSDALKANSYADLLEPIPNAATILRTLDDQAQDVPQAAREKVAQYYYHHHHHHGYYHHHHHHHHHGYWRRGPVIVVPPRRYYHHHHHHHHHHHGIYFRY